MDYTNGKQGDVTGRTIISEQSGNGAAGAVIQNGKIYMRFSEMEKQFYI